MSTSMDAVETQNNDLKMGKLAGLEVKITKRTY